MGQIKILSDRDGVYNVGEVVSVHNFIMDYCDSCNDGSLTDWIYRIPIPSAVEFIADAWGIEYKYV